MVRVSALAGAVFLILFSPVSSAQDDAGAFPYGPDVTLSQPQSEDLQRQEHRVELRDGVELATLVVTPDSSSPWPVVLVRTPYGRGRDVENWGLIELAKRGYAAVAQDVRGTGDSDGQPSMWVGEADDGFDTIQWIAKQAWCNGRVGMLGGSALGYAQWSVASLKPEALKALLVFPAISDPFFGGAYDSGVFSLPPFSAFGTQHRNARDLPDWKEEAFGTLPLEQLDDTMFGENVPIWDANLTRNGQASWPTPHWPEAVHNVQIPVLMFMTLWDGDGIGPVLNWSALQEAGNDRSYLIHGPWGHSMSPMDRRGDVSYGAKAPIRLFPIIELWFDATLKQRSEGLEGVDRARVFVTGLNEWRSFSTWPPDDARHLSLYLHPGGSGSRVGSLDNRRPAEDSAASFSYDPMAVSRSFDASVFTETTLVPFAATDPDLAFFQTAPFEADTVLGGRITLDLHFSTTGTDTDFFVFLMDVAPNDEMRVVSQPGKIRGSFLEGFDRPRPLRPNTVTRAEIRLWDVAHQFAAGHRLAIAIRSEWYPRWARNLNVFQPLPSGTRTQVATQTVHTSAKTSSVLRIQRIDP